MTPRTPHPNGNTTGVPGAASTRHARPRQLLEEALGLVQLAADGDAPREALVDGRSLAAVRSAARALETFLDAALDSAEGEPADGVAWPATLPELVVHAGAPAGGALPVDLLTTCTSRAAGALQLIAENGVEASDEGTIGNALWSAEGWIAMALAILAHVEAGGRVGSVESGAGAALPAEELRAPDELFRFEADPFVGRPPPALLELLVWQARAALDLVARACASAPIVDEGMVCFALDAALELLERVDQVLEHDVVEAFDETDPRAVPTARLARLVDDATSAAAGVSAIGHGTAADELARCTRVAAGLLRTADRLLQDGLELLEGVAPARTPAPGPDEAPA